MTVKKVCSVCRNEFWTRGTKAKYCSPECRKLAYCLTVSQMPNSKQRETRTKKRLIKKKPLLNIIDTDDKKQIAQIISQIRCQKDFEWYKSGFENLCKAKDLGLKGFLQCLEENPKNCKFSVSFGRSYFCKSPLRIYIAKKIKI